MNKVLRTKGFNSSRSRKVMGKIYQTVKEELIADLGEDGATDITDELSTLLNPASLGIRGPQEIAKIYNALIPHVLHHYFRSLDARRKLVGRYQAECKLDGWSVCENPTCARLFQLPGARDGLCSQKCRKSMRNRRAWVRRKTY